VSNRQGKARCAPLNTDGTTVPDNCIIGTRCPGGKEDLRGGWMGTRGERSADEANIRALLERWARAVRARDYPGILAGHAPEMRMFDVPPPFESRGLDEYRRTWDLFFSTSEDPVVFDFDDIEITAGRDVAFVSARMHCEPTEAGRRARLDFRLTVGLRRDAGAGWLITHEHHSVPAT